MKLPIVAWISACAEMTVQMVRREAVLLLTGISRWTHRVGVTASYAALAPPPGMPSSLARRSRSRITRTWAS